MQCPRVSCQETRLAVACQALHQSVSICRDPEDLVCCPEDYQRLMVAVSTNYPAAAFLHPVYAAGAFATVLQQGRHIGPHEAEQMHCSFPLLHAIVQICKWDVIPAEWIPLLQHLAGCASAAEMTSPVCLRPSLSSLCTSAFVPSQHWYQYQVQVSCLLADSRS